MEKRTISVNKNWCVKSTITEREEHLFYRAIRTHVGTIYTPMACSSKINAKNSVTFYVVATCSYVTIPKVTQYVTVQFDVVDGKIQEPSVSIIGPEKVEFCLDI